MSKILTEDEFEEICDCYVADDAGQDTLRSHDAALRARVAELEETLRRVSAQGGAEVVESVSWAMALEES